METAEAALARLCDPCAEVSAHWLIDERGVLVRLVAEPDRAWHAGAGAWGGVTDVNSRSIGIELANRAGTPFPAPQMASLEQLLDGIMARWDVPPERVIGHSDCAPGRKIDPGPKFDWARLAFGGRAISVPLRGGGDAGDCAAFVAAMRVAGYTGSDDPALLLAALRLRHRPWAGGPRDGTDMALARDLARRFPVDRTRPGP
ncbi:N-acetylmuramoyl-L-alanine amidase [Palleronia aestuarii]